MSSLPFGVAQLDSILGGGVPPGNVVLLAGEAGAGAREFLHTSAVTNALAHSDEELFDLYYGDLPAGATVPPEVHYLSLTAGEGALRREMAYTMTDEVVESSADRIRFRDFSREYFQLSTLPREWYVGETSTIRDLGGASETDAILSAIGAYLNEHAAGNLVAIDSLTDLLSVRGEGAELDWGDLSMLVRGLAKAAYRWEGLILLLVNEDSLTETELGTLMDAADGTFLFTWEAGGSQRARAMVVREFRGVLSRLEEENIIRFETEINEGGFDISDVRKIR